MPAAIGVQIAHPKKLVIDITKLTIGDSLKVRDLKYSGLELLDPESAVVAGIATSRVAKGSELEEEGEEGEGEEGGKEEGAASEEAPASEE